VIDRIDTHWADPAAVDSTIALAKSQSFQAATPATRKEMLSSLQQSSAISSLNTSYDSRKPGASDKSKRDADSTRKHGHDGQQKHNLHHWHREWKYIFDPCSQTWSVMAK